MATGGAPCLLTIAPNVEAIIQYHLQQHAESVVALLNTPSVYGLTIADAQLGVSNGRGAFFGPLKIGSCGEREILYGAFAPFGPQLKERIEALCSTSPEQRTSALIIASVTFAGGPTVIQGIGPPVPAVASTFYLLVDLRFA